MKICRVRRGPAALAYGVASRLTLKVEKFGKFCAAELVRECWDSEQRRRSFSQY